MPDNLLADIDYSRYRRWLGRVLGRDPPMAVFDCAGNVLWRAPEGSEPLPVGALVPAGEEEGIVPRRVDFGEDASLLCHPVRLNGQGVIGWAGIVTRRGDGSEASAGADALDDIAGAIAGEVAYKSDLLGLTDGLAECYEQLSLIYDINQRAQGRLGQDVEVYQELLDTALERMDVELVAFLRPAEHVCLYAKPHDVHMSDLALLLAEFAGHMFDFVRSSGETLVLNDPDDSRRTYILTYLPYRVVACPVRAEHRPDGLAVLLNPLSKRRFMNSDRRLAEILAGQLSNLEKGNLLIRNMRRFTEQLAAALVKAVEAKDPYTRGHSERVNVMSVAIGKAIALSEERIENLHWASLLHDIGKIGIPDAILGKPAALTEDEYTFIKAHPERGYEILRPIDHLKDALSGIRHHHERFDGTGFPAGLKGDRIPLQARVIAVADTYDAITSSRAYRACCSHETALSEIGRVAGRQLDPAIVRVFTTLCAAQPEWLQRLGVRRDGA